MFDTVLVTGGTGFIGGSFIERLGQTRQAGKIIAASRHPQAAAFHSANSTLALASLDLACPIQLSEKVDLIVHIASEKRRADWMREVNVEGTRRLLEWGHKQGVKKFIYVSSVGVYGAVKDSPERINERTVPHPQNLYEQTKWEAENCVRDFCSKNRIRHVIVQPSNVFGFKSNLNPPFQSLIRSLRQERFFYLGSDPVRFNYIAVEDVAMGMMACLSEKADGCAFILNTPTTLQRAVEVIACELGLSTAQKRIPRLLGFWAAEVSVLLKRLTGKAFPLSRERFQELTNQTEFDGSFILNQLGFTYPFGIEAALIKLVRTYREESLL